MTAEAVRHAGRPNQVGNLGRLSTLTLKRAARSICRTVSESYVIDSRHMGGRR